jgi:hypothetical protein
MKPRLVVGFVSLGLAFAAWALSVGFNLNGRQYDSWASAAGLLATALLVLGVAALAARRWEPRPAAVGVWSRAAAVSGLAVFGICLAVTLDRFHDGYQGSLVWPEALAWTGVGAFLAAALVVLVDMTRHGHQADR